MIVSPILSAANCEPSVVLHSLLGSSECFFLVFIAEAFDPDDMFKERRSQTPLSMYGLSLNDRNVSPTHDGTSSEEDLPGHYGHQHHKRGTRPTVYAYDAAAERESERMKLEDLEEAQRADSKIVRYGQLNNTARIIR